MAKYLDFGLIPSKDIVPEVLLLVQIKFSKPKLKLCFLKIIQKKINL